MSEKQFDVLLSAFTAMEAKFEGRFDRIEGRLDNIEGELKRIEHATQYKANQDITSKLQFVVANSSK
ncbi:hypothetical protein [Chitinophaga sp.]|uniref:hypothetical protein n=1 Tax=Chitinophaga sp. TaxID=1869181 RepID=UPI0031CDBDE8